MSAADLTAAPPSRRMQGLLLVTAGSVLWSTTGLLVRMLDLDLWSIQVWRSLFAAASLLLLVVAENGRATPERFRAIGWPGLALVPACAVSMASYVAALQETSVANVLIVYATVPLLAAGIAFLWIGERAGRRTLIASVAALAGIVVMAGGAGGGRDLLGNTLAFVMTATFAVQVVTARRHPGLSMAVVNALAALLCAAVAWPLMGAGVPDGHTMLILALFGVVTTGASNLLFLLGARHIPSGEAGLLGLLDTVLSPVWVWLAFGETPSWAALLGGGIVLGSVIWYLAGGRRGAM